VFTRNVAADRIRMSTIDMIPTIKNNTGPKTVYKGYTTGAVNGKLPSLYFADQSQFQQSELATVYEKSAYSPQYSPQSNYYETVRGQQTLPMIK
jgi:hypothetical protein